MLAHSVLPDVDGRRLALGATVFLLLAYLVSFLLSGLRPTPHLVVDAAANSLAAVIAGSLAVAWSGAIPMRLANRWWFVPAHAGGALAFAGLWIGATALLVGVSGTLRGNPFAPFVLGGPALTWQAFTALVLYVAIVAACYAIQAARAARVATALHHEAQLAALRARLDPHVLFNTLHSLLELVRSGDAAAESAIERFARVMRYATDTAARDEPVALHAERAMVEDYLALEQMRIGDRLTYLFDWDPSIDDVAVPALTLQPLVENAVRHGVAPRPGPGRIVVRAVREGGTVRIRVENDGVGNGGASAGAGSGIELVRLRLRARYGDRARLASGPRDGGGWISDVELRA